MCGIAGYVGRPAPGALERMGQAIEHRGPDDAGFHEAPGVGFAFRRLSIIDLAGGHQPLSNEDGQVWVMLNGEIYNFVGLKAELEKAGHRFSTNSDTEVIAHGYEEWGDGLLERINGMFAIAIWDVRKERLVIARDRLGKKPLYWSEQDGRLWFASELKAILKGAEPKRELDLIALGSYFRTEGVATPHSIFQGIQKLPPGSAMSWTQGKIEKTWSFWGCPIKPIRKGLTEEQVLREAREHIDTAVRERLMSDVPLGLFLSGGLDSAIIAESAARQAGRKLTAFTIGFDDKSYDERGPARAVADALGLKYVETPLSEDEALGMLDEAVALLDEPLADPAILPQLLLAREAKKHLTVALTGDGGDELLLGYPHIRVHRMIQEYGRFVPGPVCHLAAKGLEAIPAGSGYFSLGFKTQRLSRGLCSRDMWTRDAAWRGAFSAGGLQSLLRPEIAAAADIRSTEKTMAAYAAETGREATPWQAWTWTYLRTYLMDDVLVKVDRATMRFGIEARSPLLDQHVVEYFLNLPDRFKLGAYANKGIFKRLLAGRISREILDRPKHGFGVPVNKWLRGPLAQRLAEVTSSDYIQKQGLFEPSCVKRLMSELAAGHVDRRKEIWTLLMFQLWHAKWTG